MNSKDIKALTDDELKKLALEKRKNGNASGTAKLAQEELYRRNPFGLKNASQSRCTKRYDVYADVIDGKYEKLQKGIGR